MARKQQRSQNPSSDFRAAANIVPTITVKRTKPHTDVTNQRHHRSLASSSRVENETYGFSRAPIKYTAHNTARSPHIDPQKTLRCAAPKAACPNTSSNAADTHYDEVELNGWKNLAPDFFSSIIRMIPEYTPVALSRAFGPVASTATFDARASLENLIETEGIRP